MKQYQQLISEVLNRGKHTHDRTGVGTTKIFGYQSRYDLQHSYPLVSSKFTSLKTIAIELQWYLKGLTNTKFLTDKGVNIWNEWADENGDLGKVYGYQWRNCNTYTSTNGSTFHLGQPIDQFAEVMKSLKNNPFSRRHIISAWNVAELSEMKLPPCHAFVQWDVSEDEIGVRYLSCQLYQRSADVFLGVPYNIACYSLLTKLMAHCLGYIPCEFIHTLGDAHIYDNHKDQCLEVLRRELKRPPTLSIAPTFTTEQLLQGEFEIGKDFTLHDYTPHPSLRGKVAV